MAPQSPWHESVLPAQWQEAAAILDEAGLTAGFYLAGGTGLALQLGHRISIDLDLFTPRPFDSRSIRDALRETRGFKVLQLAEHTLHAEVASIQSSFFYYVYPLLFDAREYRRLAVADIRDIACMKIDAVSSRGSRRDFIDLYFVLREYSLTELFEWFDRKYAAAAPNRVHLAKALTYFADAELEPMPHMLIDVEWNGVKRFFETEVRKVF